MASSATGFCSISKERRGQRTQLRLMRHRQQMSQSRTTFWENSYLFDSQCRQCRQCQQQNQLFAFVRQFPLPYRWAWGRLHMLITTPKFLAEITQSMRGLHATRQGGFLPVKIAIQTSTQGKRRMAPTTCRCSQIWSKVSISSDRLIEAESLCVSWSRPCARHFRYFFGQVEVSVRVDCLGLARVCLLVQTDVAAPHFPTARWLTTIQLLMRTHV